MAKKENTIKKIENFLNKHKISGILYIPGHGVFNHFESTNEKLRLLDHAATEILYEEKKRELNAQIWIDSERNEIETDDNDVSYVD